MLIISYSVGRIGASAWRHLLTCMVCFPGCHFVDNAQRAVPPPSSAPVHALRIEGFKAVYNNVLLIHRIISPPSGKSHGSRSHWSRTSSKASDALLGSPPFGL